MIEVPALPFLKHGWKRRLAPRPERPLPSTAWDSPSSRSVEIVAPDRPSTDLLLEYAAPLFPAQIVSGVVWKVRLEPPATGGGWVLELLSLVERWLESAGLPWASVLYGDRSYLIRAPVKTSPLAADADSTRALSLAVRT